MSLLLLHLTLSLWYCTRTCYCLYYARLCLSYCIAGTCHVYKNIDNISITPAPVHLPVYSEQHPVSVIIVLFHVLFIDALAPSKLYQSEALVWNYCIRLCLILYYTMPRIRQNYTRPGVSFYCARCSLLYYVLNHTAVHFAHHPLSVITLLCIASLFIPLGHISVYITLDHVHIFW